MTSIIMLMTHHMVAGAGMLLKPEPLFEAMDGVNERHPGPKRVILMDPAGKKFNHQARSRVIARRSSRLHLWPLRRLR